VEETGENHGPVTSHWQSIPCYERDSNSQCQWW